MTTSHRETVMMAGRLKGMNREAECTVSAVKVSLPELDIWEYVQCDIHLAPDDLADGLYQVTFKGRTMKVQLLDGIWIDGGRYPRHCDLRVVVENPRGNSAEVLKGSHMAFKKCNCRLGRKPRHKTDFSSQPANPAHCAGFALSHRLFGY
jgi:hypothetical protein